MTRSSASLLDRIGGVWSHSARDVVLIVGSILIAFGLEAWWDQRQAAAEEREILVDLRSDFDSSLAGLEERWLPLHRAARASTFDLLWRLGSDEPPPDSAVFAKMTAADYYGMVLVEVADDLETVLPRSIEVPDSVVARSLMTATYDPTLSSLDALLASGSLSSISNRRLRALLAEIPAMLSDVGDEERLARDHVYTQVRPLLHGAVNAVAAEIIAYDWIQASGAIPSSARVRRSRVDGTIELANILSTRLQTQNGVVSEAENLAAGMSEVIAVLDLEIGAGDDG